MQDETSVILASIQQLTATMAATCPGFEVFEVAEGKFLACIPGLGLQSFSGWDYLVLDRIRTKLQQQQSDDALWALVYIDLWFCNNFRGTYWSGLVQRDPRNIRFAIQAALYVWCSSGSDSSVALADLVASCSCTKEAREYLEGLAVRSEQSGLGHFDFDLLLGRCSKS